MKKDDFITERTRIISEMLDNPNEEIYSTSKCFEQLDKLYDSIVADEICLHDSNLTKEDMKEAYRCGEKGDTYRFEDGTVILPKDYEGVDG